MYSINLLSVNTSVIISRRDFINDKWIILDNCNVDLIFIRNINVHNKKKKEENKY